ncbi:hypothetical protein EDD15DRAFT_1105209 [Pisolithus albus]|nr:hypothetical protein EDD15DRAFT_1105209 [Pisolithus albus]
MGRIRDGTVLRTVMCSTACTRRGSINDDSLLQSHTWTLLVPRKHIQRSCRGCDSLQSARRPPVRGGIVVLVEVQHRRVTLGHRHTVFSAFTRESKGCCVSTSSFNVVSASQWRWKTATSSNGEEAHSPDRKRKAERALDAEHPMKPTSERISDSHLRPGASRTEEPQRQRPSQSVRHLHRPAPGMDVHRSRRANVSNGPPRHSRSGLSSGSFAHSVTCCNMLGIRFTTRILWQTLTRSVVTYTLGSITLSEY